MGWLLAIILIVVAFSAGIWTAIGVAILGFIVLFVLGSFSSR